MRQHIKENDIVYPCMILQNFLKNWCMNFYWTIVFGIHSIVHTCFKQQKIVLFRCVFIIRQLTKYEKYYSLITQITVYAFHFIVFNSLGQLFLVNWVVWGDYYDHKMSRYWISWVYTTKSTTYTKHTFMHNIY